MKKILTVVLAIAMLLSATLAFAETEEKMVIGYASYDMADVTAAIMYDSILSEIAANYPDVEVLNADAGGDIEKQLSNFQMYIDQNVDFILAGPLDYDALVPVVEEADEKGITCIMWAMPIAGGDYVYIGSETDPLVESRKVKGAGELQAEYLADKLPENAKICYLAGTYGLIHAINREDGFMNTMAELRPDVEVLASLTANYARDEALAIVEDWITTFNGEFDAIVCGNDQMALGAIDALKGAGMEDRLKEANLNGNANGNGIFIVGVDGSVIETVEDIKEGLFSMTAYQNVTEQVNGLMVVLKSLIETGSADDYLVPYEVIDAANADEHIARLS